MGAGPWLAHNDKFRHKAETGTEKRQRVLVDRAGIAFEVVEDDDVDTCTSKSCEIGFYLTRKIDEVAQQAIRCQRRGATERLAQDPTLRLIGSEKI